MQTCVVHLVRNGLRYASRKYWAKISQEMRSIYTAPTVEAAEARFGEFAENWRGLYPAMVRSWESAWEEFVPFLEFPIELRKIVYTTDEKVKGPVVRGGWFFGGGLVAKGARGAADRVLWPLFRTVAPFRLGFGRASASSSARRVVPGVVRERYAALWAWSIPERSAGSGALACRAAPPFG